MGNTYRSRPGALIFTEGFEITSLPFSSGGAMSPSSGGGQMVG
jgi:hypothetical protein